MARYHIGNILKQTNTTQVTAICEPNGDNYEKAAEMFDKADQAVPPCEASFDKFMKKHGKNIDAAFIVTPHNEHCPQAITLMEAGIDVLVEKPMVHEHQRGQRLMISAATRPVVCWRWPSTAACRPQSASPTTCCTAASWARF